MYISQLVIFTVRRKVIFDIVAEKYSVSQRIWGVAKVDFQWLYHPINSP